MSLQPAIPEYSSFYFIHGVTVGFAQFGFLESTPLLGESLPRLKLLDRWKGEFNQYQFNSRKENFALFHHVDSLEMLETYRALEEENTVRAKLYEYFLRYNLVKSIPLQQWSEGLALYFDYLVAEEAEQQARQSKVNQPKYHVILDQRDEQEQLITRRLLYSMHSRQAAIHALRQHRLWQAYLWEFYNMRDIHAESVFTKYRTLTPVFDSAEASKLTVLIEYPHSRGRKRPYAQRWHWHISRIVPLVESKTLEQQAEQDHEDERWIYRPGDPKLLREHGTGLFGSYPSYEGDDEPEYRDER